MVRAAQTVMAHVIVKKGIFKIFRNLMYGTESMDAILNAFALSYLWEN
jgi:hypothetical protein